MKSIKKFFYAACIAAGLAGTMLACVDNDFDQPELEIPVYKKASNTSIADLKAMHTNGKFEKIETDLIIEGYVVSDDTEGNFYKSIAIQDSRKKDGEGIIVMIDEKGLSSIMKRGQQVFIETKGLYLGDYNGSVQLGEFTELDEELKLNLKGIAGAHFKDYIHLNGLPVEVAPREISIADLKNNDFFESVVSTLVKVSPVEFAAGEMGKTYAEDGVSQNRMLQDKDGNTLTMRNSGYSKFWEAKIPAGSGSVIGVVGKFGSTRQITIRDTNDVDLKGIRFEDEPVDAPDANAQLSDVKALRQDKQFVTITDDIVIEGVVVSSDATGNFYKSLMIQSVKDGNYTALEVKVNAKNLASRFAIGQSVRIKCKDLIVADNYGVAALGGSTYKDDKGNTKLGGIAESAITTTIFKVGEPVAVTPKTVAIKSLSNELLKCLVKIENVQFTDADKGKTFGSDDEMFAERVLTDADGNTIVVKTSKFASFKGTQLPTGSGSVVGVLSIFQNNYELMVRDVKDLEMSGDRFTIAAAVKPTPNKTIAEIISVYTSGTDAVEITEDFAFDGVVISNQAESGAFFRGLFIQDETAGIKMYVEDSNDSDYYKTLAPGQKVVVNAKGLFVIKKDYGANLVANASFGKISNETLIAKVFKEDGGVEPTPVEKNIAELTDDLLMQLVKLANVQVKEADKAKSLKDAPFLTDSKANEIKINANSYVNYKDVVLPEKSGSITGVLGKSGTTYTITLRNTTTDVELTADRFTVEGGADTGGDNTGGNTTPGVNLGDNTVSGASDLFISEYLEGNSNNKYLELYNGTGAEVDLANYSIKVGTNGKMFAEATDIALSGKLPNGATFLIANSRAALTLPDGVTASTEYSTATYYNGDDAVALLKNGTVIDVFGVEGEDPGSAWDMGSVTGATANHTIVRKKSVTEPNTTWTISEWEVKDNETVSGLGSH